MEAVRALQSKVDEEVNTFQHGPKMAGGATFGKGGSEGVDSKLQRQWQIVFRNFPEKSKRHDVTEAIGGFLDDVKEDIEE
eukprot:10430269-Karenia_brevis.AAC.1